MNKLTTEQFIKKSRDVHGDKYDYSKVEYIDSHTKVCIICPEHGEFWQTPTSHLSGRGCPICRYISMIKKLTSTTEQFIEKARKVHGDKYDYSKVEYKNNSTKVCIICPEHGEFWQAPTKHIDAKQGCPYCSNHYTRTNEQFIADARKIHGDKYDYSMVNYTASHDKVCIICPVHGEFWQTPHDHLGGEGCPSCNTSKIEKEIETLLLQYNIQFIREYNEKIFGKQELDFFIPEKEIVIECQGVQHFKPVRFGGRSSEDSIKSFYHCIDLDRNKKDICEKLGWKVFYYTKRENTTRGYKTDEKFKNIYNSKNVFLNKVQLLKKIIEE